MIDLLLKQEHALYCLKDSTTTELLYGGAALLPPVIYLAGGKYKQVEESRQ